MIYIPPDFCCDFYFRVGAVLKFSAKDIINTTVPHYFIIVGLTEEEIFMLLCTTNKERVQRVIDKHGFLLSTLVCISKKDCDFLTEDESWINCNDSYILSKEKLVEKIDSGALSYEGDISYNHYDQLRTGIKDSIVNDIAEEFLIHPQD